MAELFLRLAEKSTVVNQVKRQLKRTLDSTFTEEEEDILVRATCIVEGAGHAECNGEYKYFKFFNGAGAYRKNVEGQQYSYSILNCSLENKQYQWFISSTPHGIEPGTSKDTDYYYARYEPSGQLFGRILPPKCFDLMNKNSPSPAPTVRVSIQEDQHPAYDNQISFTGTASPMHTVSTTRGDSDNSDDDLNDISSTNADDDDLDNSNDFNT